jgi:hypothetical protein
VKHRYRDVISRRDAEYRNYMRDRDHYRGQKYHPDARYSKGKGLDDRGKGKDRGNGHGRGHND